MRMNLPIEQQVCSREWSQKLKALGVVQESLWYWFQHVWEGELKGEVGIVGNKEIGISIDNRAWSPGMPETDERSSTLIYSAFTVAELGAMLPMVIKAEVTRCEGDKKYLCELFLEMDKGEIRYTTISFCPCGCTDNWQRSVGYFKIDTEANARASALAWLIENGHIEL